MKKCSSVVWRFFERIEQNSRCVAVVCKLCESEYKYFGNTTNLRTHLINKHPIQWDLSQNGTLDETQFRIIDEDTNASTPQVQKRRKYGSRGRKDKNVRYSVSVNKEDQSGSGDFVPKIEIQRVDVLANSDSENGEDNDATTNLVRQMHGIESSDVEWLEEDPYQITHIETYEPTNKKMKYKKIKRELTSPSGLPGFYVAPKTNKRVVIEEPKKDEYSVFGEYIANKLRKFTSPRTRGNLQQLMTTILWQAEYGLYDSADAVKRVLMYSVQTPEPENSVTMEYDPQVQTVQTEEVIEQREEPNQSNESEISFK